MIHTPAYYRDRGYVSASDGDSLRVIKDIAETFGIPLTGPGGIKRGFNWLGAAPCPRQPEIIIWWPASSNLTGGWVNEFSDDNSTITEYNVSHEKSRKHLEDRLAENADRIVFKKGTVSGEGYLFVGLFHLNRAESQRQCKAIWERVPGVEKFNV